MARDTFEYVFPSIRGVQAGREYYVSMCPLKVIPILFLFNEEELKPELRAQRMLNRGRVPDLASYLIDNRDDYVFSALTASIDGEATFDPVSEDGSTENIGSLHIPMQARFIINDGQHRRAAIEQALLEDPTLGEETIAVVFFMDQGLGRCQQMFADLNRHAVKPSRSLGLLYDHRDATAKVARLVAMKSKAFQDLVEMEKSSLAARSRKLFTLSAIHSGNTALLGEEEIEDIEQAAEVCDDFWIEVAKNIPEWQLVRDSKMSAGEVRKDFLHSHAIMLQALGIVGHSLLRDYPQDWKKRIAKLQEIDWSRSNSALWEGRALVGGHVSKSRQNVVLAASAIKSQLGIELSPEEERIESNLARAKGESTEGNS